MRVEEYTVTKILQMSKDDFKFFLKEIFPLSYGKGEFKEAPHTYEWGDMLQQNNKVAILSARKHLKSTTIYAFIMWLILHNDKDLEVLYLSYKGDLAQYHTKNIKLLIQRNPFFKEIRDATGAESILKYETPTGKRFILEPEGIMSFKRGRHPHIVICDDILADPANMLNLTVINKINKTFFEDVMSLPKEGGKCIVVGTAQHQEDLFFKLKNIDSWKWGEYHAIINEAEKKVLWNNMFPYERLIEIRNKEIGEKAFNKEYMCSPVYTEEAFFTRDMIMKCVDIKLSNSFVNQNTEDAEMIIGGIDIGKHAHPSHFTIFKRNRAGIWIQLYERFLDGMEYINQVKFMLDVNKQLRMDLIFFDNTRGEFEGFLEQGIIDKAVWKPVRFGTTEKFSMAANFEKIVKDDRLKMINDERQIKSILSVNNDLDALETVEGHGDAFWGVSLALSYDIDKKLEYSFIKLK
jgi:hypothetical protein